MVSRKAGQALGQLLLPNSQKVNTSTSPYFYGMDEGQWRGYMDEYHNYIQKGGNDSRTVIEGIEDDLRISPSEAQAFYRHSKNPNNQTSRHVALGVPHAYSSEDLIRQALNASDKPSAFLHSNNFQATDLQVALGKLTQNVDVQNRMVRSGRSNKAGIAALNNLDDYVFQNVYNDASAKDSIDTILNRTANASSRFSLDKLLQRRGLVEPDMVKDALIGSVYDESKISNKASRPNQGYYDVTRPIDMYETDLNKLRGNLLNISKGEFQQMGGEIISTPRFKGKSQLLLPTNRLAEMGTPDASYINDDVRQMLIQ
jgi:hypothetical protein